MPKVKTTEEKTPPCPLCTGLTRLKELWDVEDAFNRIFKCVECSVEYPVVDPKLGS